MQQPTTSKKQYHPAFTASVDTIKQRLYQQGLTVKQWAEDNDYKPNQVYRVLSGESKALYGIGHEIAIKLGLKTH